MIATRRLCSTCGTIVSGGHSHERYRGTDTQRGYGQRQKAWRIEVLTRNPFCTDPFKVHGPVKVIAVIADHIKPLVNGEGDWRLSNGQGLCFPCHNRKTAKERGVKSNSYEIPTELLYPTNLRPSSIPLTIVCGPPAAGKSTWVNEHAQPGDVIIDLDKMAGTRRHLQPQELAKLLAQRNEILASLAYQPTGKQAFFIVGAPTQDERDKWARQLQPKQVIELKPSQAECLQRIYADPSRVSVAQEQRNAVIEWFKRNEMVRVCC